MGQLFVPPEWMRLAVSDPSETSADVEDVSPFVTRCHTGAEASRGAFEGKTGTLLALLKSNSAGCRLNLSSATAG